MLIMTTILVGAAILLFALHRKGDVKFDLRFWGGYISLEAKSQKVHCPETRSREM